MTAQPGETARDESVWRRTSQVRPYGSAAGIKYDTSSSPDLPLVLLPGTLCDARIFDPLLSRLHGASHRTLALPDGSTTTELAEQLLDQAPPRFTLLGFSLGGIVALEMAAMAPERIAGMALLNTNPQIAPIEAHPERRAAVTEMVGMGAQAFVRQVLWPSYVATGARMDDTALIGLLADMAQTLGPAVFARQTEVALSRRDRRAVIRRMAEPLLLLTGEHDGLATPDMQRRLAREARSATLAIVPGAGHFALLEAPDEVALHLADWLADVHARETRTHATMDRQEGADDDR